MDPRAPLSDFVLAEGSIGGPVFAADGTVVGITSGVDDRDDRGREQVRVIRIGDVCSAVAFADTRTTGATPPNGVHLPVEPARPFPADALAKAAQRGAATLSLYTTSSSDFDIALITPVLIRAAPQAAARTLLDFSNWSDYVADAPPVLLVRATPKLVEGFWTTVARGAAMTQGIAVPSIKHFKSGFSRMRAFCGENEVTPIHPFTLDHRVSENEVINEGLYVFDPSALGPQCGTVTLMLYSQKAPEKADVRVIDPKVVQQAWQDFVPYRAAP